MVSGLTRRRPRAADQARGVLVPLDDDRVAAFIEARQPVRERVANARPQSPSGLLPQADEHERLTTDVRGRAPIAHG